MNPTTIQTDPRTFTRVVTRPRKPPLKTPFDELLRDRRGNIIRSRSQWNVKRRRIIAAFRSTLGRSPRVRVRIAPGVRGLESLDGFERRKIELRVHADEVVTAYLCVPWRQLPGRPGVLCLPYTDDQAHGKIAGLEGLGPRAYGARLAAAGFVTLCPNHFVAGERRPAAGPFVTADFYRRYPGWSAVGKAVWDNRVCLDYLESLPMVNGDRLGCIGHSLGAHSAVFLAALDDRVRCVVSNCGLSSFRCNPMRCHWSRDGWYIYFPSLRALFLKGKPAPWDFHELCATLAPRPFLDISSLSDPTFDGGEFLPAMFIRVAEVYRLFGAADRFAFYTHGDRHGMFEHSYSLARTWLEQWLSGGSGVSPLEG